MTSEQSNSKPLPIVIFIDALGWEVLRDRKFLEQELPYRKKLRSVFGFSSACVPSILTGLWPRDHKHWSFYYYSPETSPFKPLKWLSLLPAAIFNRGRVRHLISRFLKSLYGYTGYFQIYSMPFKYAGMFDYCEKKDLFIAGNMNAGSNIFEHLERGKVNYHVSNWRQSEADNLESLKQDISRGEIDFAFLYMADMDALLHNVGKESPQIDQKLSWYEEQLRQVIALAEQNYGGARLFVCSDHGMATVHTHLDLMSKIEALGLRFGIDYTATYDSTMGRFWFHKDGARERIVDCLKTVPQGSILSDQELIDLGCDFEDQQFGELIFLCDAGVIIVPSHMGENPITGMHGYHPDDPDSDAVLLSNVSVSDDISAIPHVFNLMRTEAKV